MAANINKPIINKANIHIGDIIHHQDHSILFNSLRVINTIVSRPVKPIPLLDDVLFSLIIYFFKRSKE